MGGPREVSVSDTYLLVSRIVMPRHSNPLGILFGGYMMDWIVEAGTINTTRVSGKSSVVGFIDNVFFINPVRIGALLFYRTWVVRVRRSSMEVLVEVLVRDPREGLRLASFARSVYVALGSDGRPIETGLRVQPSSRWEEDLVERMRRWREGVDNVVQALKKRSSRGPQALYRYSVSSVRQVFYEDALPMNMMYAGALLKYIDEVSGILASSYARGAVVTASVDQMVFIRPIYVGDSIKISSVLTRTWRTSMEVKNIVTRLADREEVVVESYSTFVKLDESGRPVELEPFRPITPEEYEEWSRADERRRNRLELLKSLETLRDKRLDNIDLRDPVPLVAEIL